MAIVSSEIVADDAQADGRRTIVEHHTDDEGEVHRNRTIGVPASRDATAMMLARVPRIEERLADQATKATRRIRRRSALAKIRAWTDADIESKTDVQAKNRYGFTNPELSIIRGMIADEDEV